MQDCRELEGYLIHYLMTISQFSEIINLRVNYFHYFAYVHLGARRIAPSRRITSPLSMSFSKICVANLA